ncbi:MAG: type II CAAX endopeptidase family protein [Bacillota bacterium]|nr:type II CAAX endopeptidase family protein [Bacillota bacterium]
MKIKRKSPAPAVRIPTGVPGIKQPPRPAYRGAAGTLLLCHTGLSLGVIFLGRYWQPLQQLLSGSNMQSFVFGALLMQGLLIFMPTVIIIGLYRIPAENIAGSRASPGSLFLAIAAGIPAAVVLQGLNNLLIYALIRSGISLSTAAATPVISATELLKRPWPTIGLVLLTVVVIPAIVEELFFRGVLFASLQSHGAVTAAIIWQAIAFALFHANAFFLLPPFLAGLLLAHIRRHCGRLWPAILTHLSLNLSSLALAPLLPSLTQSVLQDQSQQANSLLYASLIAACIAAVALIPILVLIGNIKVVRLPERRLSLFPGDWKFALAILLQIATIVLIDRT